MKTKTPKFPKINGYKYLPWMPVEYFELMNTKDRAKLLKWFIAVHEYLFKLELSKEKKL